eukprot:TRINITY_DN18087_c0_g1_i1.p1 TRINITY_DN18087_c0_g1~~TRINITY_DN18087_c0_g1_i1.p1  ORF type:complete len:926 (-),score=125.31 TRINITY_DN18087_c0_g1_i1:39-2816(-)
MARHQTRSALLTLLLCLDLAQPLSGQDGSCWDPSFGFTWENCCAPAFGPGGNAACWDQVFTYSRCCGPTAKTTVAPSPPLPGSAAAAAAGGSEQPSAAEQPPPQQPQQSEKPQQSQPKPEPKKEQAPAATIVPATAAAAAAGIISCWNPPHYTEERCCNLDVHPSGDTTCWDLNLGFTFERCCNGKKPGKLVDPTQPREYVAPRLSEGCFGPDKKDPHGNPRTWLRCCGIGAESAKGCWTQGFSKDKCCSGVEPVPNVWYLVPKNEHILIPCWTGYPGIRPSTGMDLLHTACTNSRGRIFYVASVIARNYESEMRHRPWWTRPTGKELQDMTNSEVQARIPMQLEYMGNICLPQACAESDAAGWWAPSFDTQHKYPDRRAVAINSTHVAIPPYLSYRRPYVGTYNSWVAIHKGVDPERIGKGYGEFIVYGHQELSVLLKPESPFLRLMAALAAPILLASLLHCLGWRSFLTSISIQSSLRSLCTPRGPLVFDVYRLLFSWRIVSQHVRDHYPWSMASRETPAFMYSEKLEEVVQAGTPEVNDALIVLMVYLSLRRRTSKSFRPRTLGSPWWVWSVLVHALRRWAALIPFLGFWLYIYLGVLMEELPLHNVPRSHFIYLWFIYMRRDCARPEHLWSSVFLVHDAVFAEGTQCHNMGIFEAFYQVDVATFAIISGLPMWLSSVSAALLWAVLVVTESVPDVYRARFIAIFPCGLATIMLYGVTSLLRGRRRLSFCIGLLFTMADFALRQQQDAIVAAVGSTAFKHGAFLPSVIAMLAFFTSFEDGDSGTASKAELHNGKPTGSNGSNGSNGAHGSCPTIGSSANSGDKVAAERSPQAGWFRCFLAGSARLTSSLNIAHLFVIQLHRGLDKGSSGISNDAHLIEDDGTLYFGISLGVHAVGVVMCFVTFILIEGPVATLVARLTSRRT